MKILIIQLARLGDIYMGWPALRALRRQYPEADIHLMVRPRFEAATHGLTVIDRVIALPTTFFLEPLVEDEPLLEESLGRIKTHLSEMRDEAYDLVVNWTFSPLSSWLTRAIAGPETKILGYSRHQDGSLEITDDVSAFFYGQVGTHRPSRVHLTDLFATMLNIDLNPSDWAGPVSGSFVKSAGVEDYWILHPGASEEHKRIEPWQWARLIQEYAGFAGDAALPVVLIGSKEEVQISDAITAGVNRVSVINMTGQTQVEELFGLIARARLLVGGDSAPLHIASLTQTPTFNVSAGNVNFWETGPRAPRSWIYRLNPASGFPSAMLGSRVAALLDGQAPEDLLVSSSGVPCYSGSFPLEQDFAWQMVQALYLGEAFPVADDLRFLQVIEKLNEMNTVVLEQLGESRLQAQALGRLMDQSDQIFEVLAKMDTAVGVIVRWIQTEKIRIPPLPFGDVRQRMQELHHRLGVVLHLYCLANATEVGTDDTI